MRYFTMTHSAIQRCPERRMDVEHYREDGTCEHQGSVHHACTNTPPTERHAAYHGAYLAWHASVIRMAARRRAWQRVALLYLDLGAWLDLHPHASVEDMGQWRVEQVTP
jgi:hypothetical protein